MHARTAPHPRPRPHCVRTRTRPALALGVRAPAVVFVRIVLMGVRTPIDVDGFVRAQGRELGRRRDAAPVPVPMPVLASGLVLCVELMRVVVRRAAQGRVWKVERGAAGAVAVVVQTRVGEGETGGGNTAPCSNMNWPSAVCSFVTLFRLRRAV
jgi:hypothetical protein